MKVGDRFLTTEEAGRALEVSRATAYRVIKYLASKNILTIVPNQGVYVSERSDAAAAELILQKILFVQEDTLFSTNTIYQNNMIPLLHKYNQDYMIEAAFLPSDDTVRVLHQLVADDFEAGKLAGVIARSLNHEGYQYLIDSGIPAVVMGTLYLDQQRLPSIDINKFQAGKLLVEYLVKKNHENFGVIHVPGAKEGSHRLQDAIQEAMAENNLPANAAKFRWLHRQDLTLKYVFEDFFVNEPFPTAIIADGLFLATGLHKQIQESAEFKERNIEIVHVDYFETISDKSLWTHVKPVIKLDEYVQQVAELLVNRIKKAQKPSHTIRVPVKLSHGKS